MLRSLAGLVLNPLLVLTAAIAGMLKAVDMPAPAPAPTETEFFAYRVVMDSELGSPPILELVRHPGVPGCPGCVPDRGPCLATLPRQKRP